MRIAIERIFGAWHLDRAKQIDQTLAVSRSANAPRGCFFLVRKPVPTQNFHQLCTDGEDRVEREIWVLRNEADGATADTTLHLALRKLEKVQVLEQDLAGFDTGLTRQYAENGADERRLAAAGFPGYADHLSAWQVELYTVENLGGAFVCRDRYP